MNTTTAVPFFVVKFGNLYYATGFENRFSDAAMFLMSNSIEDAYPFVDRNIAISFVEQYGGSIVELRGSVDNFLKKHELRASKDSR